ncbi:MAG: valine--tRNA ligase [Candidatus Aenigmatarchaeota archaeon]
MEMPARYDPKEAEPRLQKWWEKEGLYKYDPKSKKPAYTIDTPPPTVSGFIHVGHVLGYTTAEFVARFWRMNGHNVFYPMGFDDNGLASERYVEKKRGIRASELQRDKFVNICLEETAKGGREFRNVWERLGISVDWSLLYSTINPLCQRISQRSFLDLYKKGRVYQQEGPTVWCPACQTAIAQAELEDARRTTKLTTISFMLKDGKKIQIATTRPEFLPACVAIFVHPEDKRYKGLVGKKAIVPLFGQEVAIATDEKVDPEFGTGIVMVCTFGDRTDVEWWQKHKLPLKIILDKSGRLTVKGYEGMRPEEARTAVLEQLKKEGLVTEQKDLEQTVNVHERCGTPVEFYVSQQWYIRVTDMKEKWLELGEQIRWHPEHMKVRYRQWVEGLNTDWCISRQRYYGIPFPVWHCKKCGAAILADEKELPIDPTLVKRKCRCGAEAEPDRNVMDTWATSSLTPQINARWGEKDERLRLPLSLRPQGYEIIRTWAFYTIVKAWLHSQSLPWKDVMINGMGLDPKGRAMHKSKGNVIDPLPLIGKYCADALRYWAASATLGNDMPYQEKDVATGQKLITKLWNASRFASMHIKGRPKKPKELRPMDKWLLGKLSAVITESTEAMKCYNYARAKAAADVFFWHTFCDNYLEFVKHRIYDKQDESASYTLYVALLSMIKMLAPFVPHVTEEIYRHLFKEHEGDKSVHVSAWPTADWEFPTEEGDKAAAAIAAIRQWKHDQKLPLNAELKKVTLAEGSVAKEFLDDVRGAMKVKEVAFGREFSAQA